MERILDRNKTDMPDGWTPCDDNIKALIIIKITL